MALPMVCKSLPMPSMVLLQAEIITPAMPTMANLEINEIEENFTWITFMKSYEHQQNGPQLPQQQPLPD